jgi:hypothetical protein
VALLELPASTAAQVRQARDAVQAAATAGVTRQRLLLSLPLVGATDLGARRARGIVAWLQRCGRGCATPWWTL